MMKYICGNELISTHFEVKQFLSLDRLNHDTFDPAHDNDSKIDDSTSAWNAWSKEWNFSLLAFISIWQTNV